MKNGTTLATLFKVCIREQKLLKLNSLLVLELKMFFTNAVDYEFLRDDNNFTMFAIYDVFTK